jgi:hypothetical protein
LIYRKVAEGQRFLGKGLEEAQEEVDVGKAILDESEKSDSRQKIIDILIKTLFPRCVKCTKTE